jgi:integrase
MSRRNHVPTYRLHKQSGQAVVTLPDGLGGRRDVLLGEHGTQESRLEYARVLREWETNGRRLAKAAFSDLTMNEVLLQYLLWAEKHYRDAEGKMSRELENVKEALRPLRRLYGHTDVAAFGPLALRAVRDEMIKSGLSRTSVNDRIGRIRRVFKWGVSMELIRSSTYEAIRTVDGLRYGQYSVRESEPVKPAPEAHIEAALPFMPDTVRAMVQLQRLTGCRPGEVMAMRAIDLTMTGPVWIYRPFSHKNKHRRLDRVIFLGPQAQQIVKSFLTTNLEAYLFSPRAYVELLHKRRTEARRTKRTPSELKRHRKAKPKRAPADRYDRRSYRIAIVRACRKAGIPEWSPLQLRHTAATLIRARYGVESAKVILGHTKVETTQIYAERDLAGAERIMGEIG